jgi:hypothetical protein
MTVGLGVYHSDHPNGKRLFVIAPRKLMRTRMDKKQISRLGILSLIPSAVFATAAIGAQADSLSDAISGGKVSLDVRYRYESVSQDNNLKDAGASTIRTRLGYLTGRFADTAAFIEMSNVSAVFGNDYNSTRNGKTQYAVVPDPELTVFNQAFLSYDGISGTDIRYGRQRIILDNARFIGNVGWRQTEQTFDGLTLVNASLPPCRFTYAHLTNVNTITGLNTDISADLLNAGYRYSSALAVTGYAYLLDFENAAALSSSTYGLRITGAPGTTWILPYAVEYARQGDYADNPANFGLDYWLAELGAGIDGNTIMAGYEVLSSDGTNSVQTPLATLHAFNGWADQFLTTPSVGLEDRYISASGGVLGAKLQVVYHSFRANKGGGDLGSEWDLSAALPINKMYAVTLAGARYRAGDAAFNKVDTNKLWLTGEMKF